MDNNDIQNLMTFFKDFPPEEQAKKREQLETAAAQINRTLEGQNGKR